MPPRITNPRQLELPPQAEAILGEMFRDYQEVILKADLSSLGYSGSWVYRVHLLRESDSLEIPLVVKLAPADLIAREARAYQEYVRNQWPGIAELRGDPVYLDEGDLGGLCYPLLGGGVFEMQSLHAYCLEADVEDVGFVLRERLFRMMRERVLRPARNAFEFPLRASYDQILPVNLLVEPCPAGQTRGSALTLVSPGRLPSVLLEPGDPVRLEGFVVSEVNPRRRSVTLNVPADKMRDAYRLRLCPAGDPSAYAVGEMMTPVEGVVRETRDSLLHKELVGTFGPGFDPECKTVALPDDGDGSRIVLPNPLLAIPEILDETRHVKVNAIHGDLNLENVLVDPQVRDVRLIDFAGARQDHVLHDLLRLETEVVTKLLPAALAKADLPPQTVVSLYGRLHDTAPASGAEQAHPVLERSFAILRSVRRTVRDGLYDRDDLGEYYQCLILYLVAALKFENLDARSKQVAFWGAAALRQLLVAPPRRGTPHVDASHPLARPGNLPGRLTPFVGRETELAAIRQRLLAQDCRMLTVVGPGGIGKTRLAQEVAVGLFEDSSGVFADGVYYVPLASLQSTEGIVPSIAQALSFSFYQGSEPQQQLWDYLCKKSVLFVFDNFDHLVDGAGEVTDLLEAAPRVKILVTSRVRLCVQDEFLFPLNGLDIPEQVSASIETSTASAAVRLFMHGARRVQPAFGLTMENLAHVVQICRLVQGMPLGILLAAAWVQMLSPAEIAAEVGQSVDLLETDLRDVPERQRSIRAVFDHSWNLLTDEERGVFQALSVFRGGFTQKAVRQVTGASLRNLRRLVDKSLLHRTSSGRYEIHSLLVQCAGEKLAQSSDAGKAVQDRHRGYYAAKLQRWGKDLRGPRQQAAEAEMESEIDNVRIAWERMVDQRDIEQLDQAIEGLCLFYLARVRSREGESACRAIANGLDAAASHAECEVLARALAWMGIFGWLRGQTEPPIRLLEESLRLLERPEMAHRDTRSARALVLCQMGIVLQYSDRDRANRLYEQSMALYRSTGDRWGEATALQHLGWLTSDLGKFRMAQVLLRASLRLRRRLGDRRGIASVLRLLGVTAICMGRLGQGRRLIRESAAIYREMEDRAGICDGLREQGFALLLSGRLVEARTLLRKSMALADDLGHRWQLAEANLISGFALVLSGEYREAHDAGQRGLLLSREIGYQRGIALALFLLGCLAVAATEFADAQRLLQESVDIYQVLGQRHELGQAYAALTYAERGLGRREEARRCLALALRTSIDIEAPVPLLIALPAAALLAADQGEIERALALYALVLRLPVMANSRLFEDVAGKHICAASAALPPEAVAAAKDRVRVRHLGTTAAELLDELRRSSG